MKSIFVGDVALALVDDEDFEILAPVSWALTDDGYARGRMGGRMVLMHRVIMSAPYRVEVDHRNLDKLDNRRENLRLATRAVQTRNLPRSHGRAGIAKTSRYRGVFRHGRKWVAELGDRGVSVRLGSYMTEEAAARAYDLAVLERFGVEVRVNLPDSVALFAETPRKVRGHIGLAGRPASDPASVAHRKVAS